MRVLAVAVLTLNEQRDLPRCLESLRPLDCDVFVFDSGSADATVELAKKSGANVVQFSWDRRYPKKKQYALNYLKPHYRWVLLLDADESLSSNLAKEIANVTRLESRTVAYDCKLDYVFQTHRLRFGQVATKRILVQPNYVKFPEIDDLQVSNMWEVEGHYQPQVSSGKSQTLRNRLRHEDSDGLFAYFQRHNRYSDWEAYVKSNPDLRENVLKARPLRARFFDKIPFKPFFIWFLGYVLKFGFLDGRAGFHFAVHQAFYYWQIEMKSDLGRVNVQQ